MCSPRAGTSFDRHLAKPFEFRDIEAAIAEAFPTVSRGRIVVVDDSAAMRSNLREVLEGNGWDVEEACDGAEALETVARFAPAVVLLDYRMPGMDGGEVAQRLAAANAPPPQVVLMTAAADVRDIATRQGFRYYVARPFAPDVLLGTIACAAATT